jgi:hypothetical protein
MSASLIGHFRSSASAQADRDTTRLRSSAMVARNRRGSHEGGRDRNGARLRRHIGHARLARIQDFAVAVGAVIAAIDTVISLSAIKSLLSLSAALVATWVMHVTTQQAGLGSSITRVGAGPAHRAGGARHLSDAQRRYAVHHARPARARQSSAGHCDHGLSAGVRAGAYSSGAGMR